MKWILFSLFMISVTLFSCAVFSAYDETWSTGLLLAGWWTAMLFVALAFVTANLDVDEA